MNIDSFTDEQLLNLVNSTIENEANMLLSDFTGGSTQITTSHNHKVTNYKIMLYFGYNEKRNPITYTEEITKDEFFIWSKAIMLKVESMKVSQIGDAFNRLNKRMNNQKEKSNKKEKEVVGIGKEVVGIGMDSTSSLRVRNEVITNEKKDAMIVAKYLLSTIQSFKENFKTPNTLDSWVNDIEKAIRIDRRTREQLIGCIDWIYNSKQGEFWIPNILSGKKLREKYDTMEAQMMMAKKDNKNAVDNIYDNGLSAKDLIKEMEKRA